MPGWVQVLIVLAVVGDAALVLVAVVEVRRLTRHLARVGPQLDLLAEVFEGWPDHFGVLDEILAQFKTNSGHTLRDVVNRLDQATGAAVRSADRMEGLMAHLDAKVSMGVASSLRSEEGAAVVAEGLVVAQRAVDDVAADLLASHVRADDAVGPHGAQADAASRSPEESS